ncbi:hypothetical protein C8R45DRAFT_992185, partial [Mycena sanguinolenta]
MPLSSPFCKTSSSQSRPSTSDSSSRSSRARTREPASMGGPTEQSEPSRRRRRSSPPSMYGMYDTALPKPPKPLLKLNKKKKAQASPDTHSPSSQHQSLTRTTPAQSVPTNLSQTSGPDRNELGKPSYQSVLEKARERGRSNTIPPSPDNSASAGGKLWDDEYLMDDLYCDSEDISPTPILFSAPSRPPTPQDDFYRNQSNEPFVAGTNASSDSRSLGSHVGRSSGAEINSPKRWIGEWNRHDMQEVICKLRSLKY